MRQSRRDQLAEMIELRDFADRSNNARSARRELTRRNHEKVMLAGLRLERAFSSRPNRDLEKESGTNRGQLYDPAVNRGMIDVHAALVTLRELNELGAGFVVPL